MKTTKNIALLAILFFTAFAVGCGGSSKKAAEMKHTPEQLLAYLQENVNLQEGMSMEVDTLTNENCRVRVFAPKEIGSQAADVVGTGICTLSTKWLSENGYSVDLEGVHVSCYVYSPHEGVTGKPGMVVRWGHASYDPNTDNVKWKWDKSN